MVEFPEDPNRDDPEMAWKAGLTGVWSGTYSFDEDVLSLVKVESDVEIYTVPEGLFENEIDAKNEILEKFNTHVF